MYASGFVFVISDRSYKDSVWCTICRANIYCFLFKIGRITILLGELFSGLILLLLFQIGLIKLLLCVLFVGLVVGSVFLGNFITHSDALGECHFSTSRNDTMTRTEEESQCATYKGSSVACIVFFILTFYIMLRNCDDRKIEKEKIVHPVTSTTPSTTTVSVTSRVEQDDVSLREVSIETPPVVSPSAPALHEAQSQQTPQSFSVLPPRYSQVIKQPL